MREFGGEFQQARRLYRERRLRDEMLGYSLFGEPAWDILLELYAARCEDRPVSVMIACIGAAVSVAEGLETISLLEEHSLIERIRHGAGESASWIVLTEAGFQQMTELLRQLLDARGGGG